ncbi:MAG: hypothetical protein PVJ04_16705 [Gemmatimonadota bacterium]|jgi:hypothetical protein
MNTRHSDERIQAWKQRENPLERGHLVLERTFRTSADEVFPLLCPTREYDWISSWGCELFHSDSGYAEYNAIFRTRSLGKEEIWICTHFEPNRAIHYTRVAPDVCTQLEITLADRTDGTVRVRWSLTASALVEEANDAVRLLESGSERRLILEHLLNDLDHYLERGEMRV